MLYNTSVGEVSIGRRTEITGNLPIRQYNSLLQVVKLSGGYGGHQTSYF